MLKKIKEYIESSDDKITCIEEIKTLLHSLSPIKDHPIDNVKWVNVTDVQPNDYNPNSVAGKEMSLLYHSIKMDGYTQPVVTIWDEEIKKYVIIDGFHRYFVGKLKQDIQESTKGKLPIVVLKKDINERMASTVRHNRARGEHSIAGMSNLVFSMLQNGWKDSDICNHIGLEAEELIKLKHLTGFSKLFENIDYSKSWETPLMIKKRLEYEKNQKDV